MTSIADVLQLTDDWPVGSVAAAVRADDGSWHTHGATEQVFALASVTKLLSAHAVLIAMEEGALGLDDEAGPPGATVRHLLAHASGVGFSTREPEREPGQRRVYSSVGFEILAEKVAADTGIEFAEYLRLSTFEPLGMDASSLTGSAGHGAEASTVDLMAFVDAILAAETLHPDTLDEAFTVQFPGLDGVVPGYGPQSPADWGLGFEIFSRPTSKQGLWFGASMPADVAGHFGQSGTFCWVHRDTGRACVVLTDRDFGPWAKPLWSQWNDQLWGVLEGN
ncbi:beta-lactamase family protein [Corynebacterium sp. TAE3-ERU12]|uniref:serine hydrolase domain-containing protein n=1 Tax=Corynebacterium sp. TAE3-ERU12 TaxID=2849491 RepID=UPI001C449A96|nr:serine hydrolase domain-containing protein [Corynebacterium sp. TAE3-ERU12]MBV7295798.1 beta-lactamase family protein [Corynebacterium sp. TAE3-ERU12]